MNVRAAWTLTRSHACCRTLDLSVLFKFVWRSTGITDGVTYAGPWYVSDLLYGALHGRLSVVTHWKSSYPLRTPPWILVHAALVCFLPRPHRFAEGTLEQLNKPNHPAKYSNHDSLPSRILSYRTAFSLVIAYRKPVPVREKAAVRKLSDFACHFDPLLYTTWYWGILLSASLQ